MNNEKNEIIDYLSEQFKKHNCFYIIDATGLSVSDINLLRRECHKSDVLYKVAKNSLIAIAINKALNGDVSTTVKDQSLKGFSGVMFVNDNGNIPAKLIDSFRSGKPNNVGPFLKCACIDGDLFLGDDKVVELKNLKSKNELIGEIIGLLQSPIKNVISGLCNGSNDKISGILKALSNK